MPTNYANGGYKERARLSGKKTREWKLQEFENPARSDGMKLTHWAVKENDPEANRKYPFSEFKQITSFPTYSDSEYNVRQKTLVKPKFFVKKLPLYQISN